MTRKSKPFHSHTEQHRSQDEGFPGRTYGRPRFDPRTLGEIISDWQVFSHPGDSNGFIETLGLSGALTEEQLLELMEDRARPLPALGYLIAALVPERVASWVVTKHRVDASRKSQPVITIPPDALSKARLAALREIVQGTGEISTVSPELEQLRTVLLSWLEEKLGRHLDARRIMDALSAYCQVDASVFSGSVKLPQREAKHLAGKLASLLRLQGESFDEFMNTALNAFAEGHAKPSAGEPLKFARAFRFLRQACGLTTQELGLSRFIIQAIWRGYVPTATEQGVLFQNLPLSAEEGAFMTALAEHSRARSGHLSRIRQVVQHFGANNLTAEVYLKAAQKMPTLYYQAPETIIDNIEKVVEHFTHDGLTAETYLKAACKRPRLFGQQPPTIIANIERVVDHFAHDGLTAEAYLKAACNQPQLFNQQPHTIIGNITSVVQHFTEAGLTTAPYLKAACRQPALFCQRPKTIIGNIESVVLHFADFGLTTTAYLNAARKRPALFSQRPTTIVANIESVVERFTHVGLTAETYLEVACRHPKRFCQRSDTVSMRGGLAVALKKCT